MVFPSAVVELRPRRMPQLDVQVMAAACRYPRRTYQQPPFIMPALSQVHDGVMEEKTTHRAHALLSLLRQMNDVLSLGLHRVWKRAAVKWSGAEAGQTVLDVCCGSGDLAFLLAEAVGLDGKACAARHRPV